MKVTQLVKNTVLASAMVASVVAGTMWAQSTAPKTPTTGPVTPPAAATAPADVVAVVNGMPVSAKWFNELLMAVAGPRVFPQALDLVLVQQECAKQQIPMQGPDFEKRVQAEIDRALDALEEQGVPHDERNKMIAILLQKYGRTQEEFLISMHVSAGLRKLSDGRVNAPTPEEIQQAFDVLYGSRVEGKLITLKTLKDVGAVRDKLQASQSLEQALQAVQPLQVQARILPEKANIEQKEMKSLRDAAFATPEKGLSNSVSETLKNGDVVYHVIYVDKKIPADAKANLSDPAIKARLEKVVSNSKQQQWMNNQLRILQQTMRVDIKDPTLSAKYEAYYKATTQATQPAANGATTAPLK